MFQYKVLETSRQSCKLAVQKLLLHKIIPDLKIHSEFLGLG